MGRDDLPKYLVSDRDGIFGNWMSEFLKSCYDIILYRTPQRTPNCNAFSERFILSALVEITDRMIIYNENHLREVFGEYVNFYNKKRPHQSLSLNTPLLEFKESVTQVVPKYKKKKLVRGTVTEFCLAS